MSSKFFEDVVVGDLFESSGRTICEADFVNFAGVSGDFSPLHSDEEFAKTTRFKGRIAHGFLTLSVTAGLLSNLPLFNTTVVALLQIMNVKFVNPVRAGDTIFAQLKIVGKKKSRKKGKGVVSVFISVRNQENIEVLTLNYDILVKSKSSR